MTPPPRDVLPDDVTLLYQACAEEAVKKFNANRECFPSLTAIELGDSPGEPCKVLFIDPNIVNLLQGSAQGKQAMMAFVRLVLAGRMNELLHKSGGPDSFSPHAVLHVSECYVVHKECGEIDDPLSVEALDGHASLEDHPERKDAIAINVHTKERSYGGLCPIEGTGDARRAFVGPLLRGFIGCMSLNDKDGHDIH